VKRIVHCIYMLLILRVLQDLVKIIAMGKVFFRHKIEVLNYI